MVGYIHTRRLTVQFGHCDPARIVYYPNYLAWIDQATHELFDAVGASLRQLQNDRGMNFPIVNLAVDFTAPAAWGDELEIASEIERWGTKSVAVLHRVQNLSRATEVLVGRETRACVLVDTDEDGGIKSAPVPDWLRQRFELV